jgi:hypothetical protein
MLIDTCVTAKYPTWRQMRSVFEEMPAKTRKELQYALTRYAVFDLNR